MNTKLIFKTLAILFCIVFCFLRTASVAHGATLLSDTFAGSTISTTNWTVRQTTAGNVSQNNGLIITGNGAWGNGVTSVPLFDRTNGDLTMTVTVSMTSCTSYSGVVGYGTGNVAIGDEYDFSAAFGQLNYRHNGSATSVYATGYSCAINTPVTIRLVIKQAGGADVYLNGAVTPNASTAGSTTFTNNSFFLNTYTTGATSTFTNLSITGSGLPSAPSNVIAAPGNTQALVTFNASTANNGSSITGYTVTSSPDNITATGSSSPILVSGLTNGTPYTFTVTATNANGNSVASSPSSDATPLITRFLTIDTFAGTTINSSNWTVFQTAPGSVVQNNGLAITGSGGWVRNYAKSGLLYDRAGGDLTLTTTVSVSSCGSAAWIGYGNLDPNGTYVIHYAVASGLLSDRSSGATTTATATGYSCAINTPVTIRLVIKQAGGADVYLNGAVTPNASISGTTAFTSKNFWLQTLGTGITSTFTNFSLNGPSSVPPTPTNVIGAANDGQVNLTWTSVSNGNIPISSYLVEYKLSSSPTWIQFASPTGTSSAVTGLTNGLSYDFRISAVNATGSSAPTTTVTAIPNASTVNHLILSTGQSLSVGYMGTPSLTTTQPFNNQMPNASNTALIPLTEPATGADNTGGGGNVETMSSALANYTTNATQTNYPLIIGLHGVGSTGYSGLKKGTTPYNNGMAQATAANSLSAAAGKTLVATAVTTIHGETDENGVTTANQYRDYLLQWQGDYQTDTQAITGQSQAIPLFTDQMSSWNKWGNLVPHVAIGQYLANKAQPNKIVLVTPMYIFDYVPGSHITNYGYRRLGEYFGKVYKQVVVDGRPWTPLSPKVISRSGNIITAKFNVPVGALQFDTTAVDAQTNYGFEYADDTSSATISSVAITSADTVQVTLSTTPTGTNPVLRYAYTASVDSAFGAHVTGSPRGNLRDSDTTQALYQDASVPTAMGNNLYNWAVTFSESVLSADATLSNLTISQGTLSPAFSSSATSYTASVGNGVTSLTVTPTVNQANATVTVNGTPVTSGAASGAITLDVGNNTITTVVTAQDGVTTNTYTIVVTRAAGGGVTSYPISVYVTPHGSISPGSQNIAQGGSATFNITPNTGYQIAEVLVNNISVGAKSTYTFTNVTQSHTILANFSPIVADTVIIPKTEDPITGPLQQKIQLITQIKQQLIPLLIEAVRLLTLQIANLTK